MIMRNCCCCKVTTGSLLLGILTLIAASLVLVPLIGFITDTDIQGLNVIKQNQKIIEKVLEDSLKTHSWTKDNKDDIMRQFREWFPTVILVNALYAGITALFSFILVLGVSCKVRCLMIPYLILFTLDIIMSGILGFVIVVALFYFNTIQGVVATAVYLVAAVVSLYCWAVILSAYKFLGADRDTSGYIYSPVTPSKDAPQYYPSAPQYFAMDDYTDRSTRR